MPKYEEWIPGNIVDIEYDEHHKSTYQGEEKVRPAVRIKFGLEGCQFPKRSRWLTFNYGEKANLYKQFVSHLVEDAEPDMDLDLDVLKGMKVKTMWSKEGDDGEYDKLEMVRPLGEKVKAVPVDPSEAVKDVPF